MPICLFVCFMFVCSFVVVFLCIFCFLFVCCCFFNQMEYVVVVIISMAVFNCPVAHCQCWEL